MKRTLKALEFDKVLEHFSRYCVSDSAKEQAFHIVPHLTPYGVEPLSMQHNLNMFSETQQWLIETRYKLPTFAELQGVIKYLQSSQPLLEIEALWAVKEVLTVLKNSLLSILEAEQRRPFLAAFIQSKPFPEQSFVALQRCIGDSAEIKDNASPSLLLVRNELRGLHQTCLRKVKEAATDYNITHYLQDDYITLASDRYVLPLKSNFKGRLQGIIHHYSNTGETVFFEPMFLVEINNRIQELKQEEREEERKVMTMLTSVLLEENEQVEASWSLLLELDILQAKVAFADAFHGHCLTMEEDAELYLPEAKHPLLVLEAKASKRSVQPLHIELRQNERVLVISGGNAGGKTVCLKTVGLITLMTLAGLPVPVAENATMPILLRVHAFIGDEQSLDDHVSTFTGQIRHLAGAWDKLSEKALILLDEFGAGTDPSQGAALAQAVLDGILDKHSYAFAATHFPALKTYALTHEHVRAASVLFEPSTKKPLFTLAYDQVGASQALDVAREHGLPESILKKAEQYLLLDGEDMSAVLDRLNTLATQRETELEKLKKEENAAIEKRKSMQEKFETERKKLYTEVRSLSSELMQAWKSGKQTAKQSLKEMSKLRSQLLPQNSEPVDEEKTAEHSLIVLNEVKIGQTVLYKIWGKKATVLDIDEKNKKIKLDMNGVSLWAYAKDVEFTQGDAAPRSTVRTKISALNEPKSTQRLDIRGKRADLALAELETFLDRALLNSTDCVEIVHGKGTGALRKTVHDFLRTFAMVDSYVLGNEEQGGDGITLVTFR